MSNARNWKKAELSALAVIFIVGTALAVEGILLLSKWQGKGATWFLLVAFIIAALIVLVCNVRRLLRERLPRA